ncbi:hypothetical protein K457DRAFT_136013 [Linnemannia elongata AG-77]|uniref:Hyaluronan/mRNA-binding protein domain-containing protein n=1 Tax=Linnemannia elongata AG-77 TaxID=1314771 RepID=A0A197K1L2_9FUNG|nr:hypothetical protein K457DRAFT_136013 [Linnemannia elongata AG-77]
MTRTRTGGYKDSTNAPRERHQSRNGFSDPRAIPKKAGAGHGNWGVPGCELNQQEQTSALSDNVSTSPAENKITVIDAETFSKLQNNANSQAQSTANDDQASY